MTTCSSVWTDHCITIVQFRADTVITTELSSSYHSVNASYRATQCTYPPISYNSTIASSKEGERFHHCTPTTSFTTVYHSTQICFAPLYTHQYTSIVPRRKFPSRSRICHTTHTQSWICGCAISYLGSQLSHCYSKLSSAFPQPAVLDDVLASECSAGQIIGPIKSPPLLYLHCSGLKVIPKHDGGWCTIYHLSLPHMDPVSMTTYSRRQKKVYVL